MTMRHIIFGHTVMSVGLPDFTVIANTLGNEQRVVAPAGDHIVPHIPHFTSRLQIVTITVKGKTITTLVQSRFVHR